jgi:hypothetical protein
MWFEKLTGFPEENHIQVQQNIEIKGKNLISKVNGSSFQYGSLEIPKLSDLRQLSHSLTKGTASIRVSEQVGNIQEFHCDPLNNGALFQAASQFNILEMVGPEVTPESGVGIYEYDNTQGPACAISCGAGTIYRNYFAEVNGRKGQTKENQIDCLNDLGRALGNENESLWQMKNGYALPNVEGLLKVNSCITNQTAEGYDQLKALLRVGIQWDTQVTINDSSSRVSQVYCSALPVSYSHIPQSAWEPFARMILEACYEATFHAGLINYNKTGNPNLYLTLVGGGAFGNSTEWIFDALRLCLTQFKSEPLDVRIVSYGRSNPAIQNLIASLKD